MGEGGPSGEAGEEVGPGSREAAPFPLSLPYCPPCIFPSAPSPPLPPPFLSPGEQGEQEIMEPHFDGRTPHVFAGDRWTETGLGHDPSRVGIRQDKGIDCKL